MHIIKHILIVNISKSAQNSMKYPFPVFASSRGWILVGIQGVLLETFSWLTTTYTQVQSQPTHPVLKLAFSRDQDSMVYLSMSALAEISPLTPTDYFAL